MFRTTFPLALLLCLPIAATAQTYKCRQQDGSLSYQDHACQAGAAGTTIAIPADASRKATMPPASGAGAQASYQDKLRDSERRHIAEETKAQNAEAQAYNQTLRCTAARQQLGLLREQRPVYRHDDAGGRKYVDDKDRPREIMATQQIVADECR